MALLPQAAWAYAVRGGVTAALLAASWGLVRREGGCLRRRWGVGVATLVGLVVFLVWIAPEPWLWPGGDGAEAGGAVYAPATCGWALSLAKLCASAFVISVAEELFFRKWLVEFAGFGWMLVLFGVEHMRWDLGVGRGCVFIAEGVFAGLAYGLLARRYGLPAAIVAHAVTNLVLGFYVIFWGKWFYW